MSNDRLYWTSDTNEAIDTFVIDESISHGKLNQLYTQFIYPPIDKMIRIIIHKYNLYNTGLEIDELVNVGHAFVYENLLKSREHKNKYYDPSKKSSFHYYTTIIKNELVRLQIKYQYEQQHISELPLDDIDFENITEETNGKLNDGEFLLSVSLDWLETNYEDVFTHWIDKDITKSFLKAVRSEGFNIKSIKGLSSIVYGYSTLDEKIFYSRYYETRTVHNEIYSELRRKYDNGERISAETEIQLYKVY